MSSTIQTIGKTYNLQSVTGKVAASNKNMETKVHGSGGGGQSYNGYGYTAPVNIQSTTTIHDEIFLVDSAGSEHSFQLQNFNVACREGNDLMVTAAIKTGRQSGYYIVVTNKTTGNIFFNNHSLYRVFRPTLLLPLALSLVLFYIGTGGSIMLGVCVWIAYFIYPWYKSNQFKKTFNPEQLS